MQAIIIAGGRGERLQPLTLKTPKPMLKVKGKPILEHVLNFLKHQGVTDFTISVGYLAHKIIAYFGDGSGFGVKITYLFDKKGTVQGTAGALSSIKQKIKGTFVVTYADILRELDLSGMVRFHKKHESIATINVYQYIGSAPKSMVIFDRTNQILEFKERPSLPQHNRKIFSNGSLYIFEPKVLECIIPDKFLDFGRDIFPLLIAKGEKIFSYPSFGYFLDVGTINKLKHAQKTFKPIKPSSLL